AERRFGEETDRPFLDRLGTPEPPVRERVESGQRMALGKPTDSALEALIRQRVTCRNWDTSRPVSAQDFAHTLYRTFAARAVSDQPGIEVMKRAVPSAGGLHPTEAYLLVQNVEGVAPGLYHYHPIDHALEPLGEVAAAESQALALRLVAGQRHFMKAHVLVVLASRFRRTFWKYRNHAKAYRAVILDAGHLSQTLYLAAAERGLAAFITAAVNERDIEQLFGLDPMQEGVLAVSGFGWRGAEQVDEAEFDPLGSVWPKSG
ncbi:MAG: putative peptide maturation dehydrogenase, partial [Rhodanobacteraceae bacterium]|nr:putative peptide maturation dehydrogenase [Rhodanobacteraceae bacterium]